MNYSNDKNRQRRKNTKSSKKKAKNKVRVIIFRVLIAVILITCFAGAGAAFGAYIGILENAETIDSIAVVVPQNYASIVYDKDGNEIDRYTGEENREYVTLDQIPVNLHNAFIAIEDERFYSHNGIDMKGIVRSFYSTVFQSNRQGASTLTQQIIKNNVLNLSRNTLTTKLQEQYLAVKYESMLEERLGSKALTKAYILEVYMNSIGLNHGLNGVQTASKYYFNKDVSELTLSECAVIAAITQRPNYYTPALNPENNQRRQRLVLSKMLELGFITEAEYNEAINDNVYERVGQYVDYGSDANKIHSYYSDQLIEDLSRDLQEAGYSRTDAYNLIYNGGLEIHTPIDTAIQELLEETFMDDSKFSPTDYRIDVDYFISVKNKITDELNHYEEKFSVNTVDQIPGKIEELKDQYLSGSNEIVAERFTKTVQPQGSMVVLDYHTGYVRGIVGGRGEKTTNRGFNRATQSKRHPGSVFKVLAAYAPAIDLGVVNPGTVYIDEPYTYENYYSPNNWYSGYRGAVTIRDGIRDSMNIVTVKVLVDTGINACFDYLLQFGFSTLVDGDYRNGKTFTDRIPSLALGGITDGVTVLETTAAFGTIANGGVYLKPTFYTIVYDHDGDVLLEYIPEKDKRQVLKETSAYLLTDMMKDVLTSGTGTRARLSNMPAAGKTGTSQDTKDLVYAGYTAYYAAGIWYGYDISNNLKDTSSYHLSIWKYVMDIIHQDLPYKDFDRPDGITNVSLCADSGLRAVPGLCENDIRGSRIRSDLVAIGNVPTESCNIHATITIDTSTGMLADFSTPEDRKFTFTGVVVDDERITDKEYEIPRSMTITGSRTRLNSSYGDNLSEDETQYIYDPEGNIVGIQNSGQSTNEQPLINNDDSNGNGIENSNNHGSAANSSDSNTAPPDIVVPTPPVIDDPADVTAPTIDYGNEDAPPIIE